MIVTGDLLFATERVVTVRICLDLVAMTMVEVGLNALEECEEKCRTLMYEGVTDSDSEEGGPSHQREEEVAGVEVDAQILRSLVPQCPESSNKNDDNKKRREEDVLRLAGPCASSVRAATLKN